MGHGARSQNRKFRRIIETTVIPTKAGIQWSLDSRLRGDDDSNDLPPVLYQLQQMAAKLNDGEAN